MYCHSFLDEAVAGRPLFFKVCEWAIRESKQQRLYKKEIFVDRQVG
jgi:hypothetical protein